MYRKARRINKTAIWEKYRQLNYSVKKLCNKARWTYVEKLTLDVQENENPKPFWNFVKSKRRGTNELVSLKGTLRSNDVDGNENVKKNKQTNKGFYKQNNNFALASRFFVHFFARFCTTRT